MEDVAVLKPDVLRALVEVDHFCGLLFVVEEEELLLLMQKEESLGNFKGLYMLW